MGYPILKHVIRSWNPNRGKTDMKLYSALNHLPISGMIVLIAGSVITGIALGVLAYFISNLLYLVFIFPVLVGFAGALVYQRLVFFTKVRHNWLTPSIGFAAGILIAAAFYASSDWWVRHDVITSFQKEYATDVLTASSALDTFLTVETGSSGFWGFMKLRAAEGDQFTNYLVINSMPVSEFRFTMKSPWVWIYWGVEALLFALPLAWIGFEAGKLDFNHSANNWYSSLPKLRTGDLLAVSELQVKEGEIPHPVLEIYEQHSKNEKGAVLLSVKQTKRVSSSKVKRITVSQYELSQTEFNQLADAING
jgi:hypothetical protein